MATITHDAQSLLIDGRRIWLVSGSIDYFRVPRGLWLNRLRAAQEAGLNTIMVRCPWAIHEPRKGDFDFEGDQDVAAFVEMIRDLGMRCILRVGPFVGGDLDLGGMPSWLLAEPDLHVREGNAPFLEAASRYFGKLLKVLESFSGTNGGPVVAVQCEHEWYCGNEIQAEIYLLEIARFIREHGFDLPLLNTNNLWQRREETIDTWSGRDDLLAHLRQLRVIHPNTPLIVGDYWIGGPDIWNEERGEATPPMSMQRKLAQVLAAGGQYNLAPFHGGTNFGFMAARIAGAVDRYSTTSADSRAPLGEAGEKGELYHALRRVCTFASNFERVFAALEPDGAATIAAVDHPESEEGSSKVSRSAPSVAHLKGAHGEVVFVFGEEDKKNQSVRLLMPDGMSAPVFLGDQPVAWLLMNTHVGGRATLDYTNLNVFAGDGRRLLVLFGAAGQPGIVSVNQGQIEFEVPRGQTPTVIQHEDINIVVCNGPMVDATHLRQGKVYVGIEGFDADGEPIPCGGWKRRYEIDSNGELTRVANPSIPRRPPTSAPADWEIATIRDYLTGEAPRYATIDGPATQESCAAGSGYGFIRLSFARGPGKKMKLLCPGIGDRVQFFVDGEPKALVGFGPGAEAGLFELSIPRSKAEIVALIDNLGRYGGGNDMNEGKGLVSHLHEVKPIKMGRTHIEEGPTIRPFDYRGFIEGLHGGATTAGQDIVWRFEHRRKSQLILEIVGAQTPAVIVLNQEPIAFYFGRTGRPFLHLLLDEAKVRRGKNEVRIAPLVPAEESDLVGACKIYESTNVVTEQATWAFAKWEKPKDAAFVPLDEVKKTDYTNHPVWYRSHFNSSSIDRPCWIEPTGLTKGQLYVNGHNIGRYFVATSAGTATPPQLRYFVPSVWLHDDKPNELLIFEEHGKSPSKVKVTYGDSAF
ncbi:MAG: beta-galactosidase [Phycisphaerales bacterium]